MFVKRPTKQFVFGENITERVVNTNKSATGNGEAGDEADEGGESGEGARETSDEKTASASATQSSWLNDAEAEKYTSMLNESDIYSLCKLNCKLYVLEADKTNWAERGYGILKVIETSDGNNCKISKSNYKATRLMRQTK